MIGAPTRATADQPARVVLFVSHTASWGGGAEVVLLQLMAAARDAGWIPHLVCPRGPLAARADFCASIHHLAAPQLRRTRNPLLAFALVARWLVAMTALTGIVLRSRASIVHANSGISALIACLPAIMLRRPLIWHQHDIVPARRSNRLLGLCGRLATTVVGCSRAVTGSLAEIGVPRNRLHVEYNRVRSVFLRPPSIWDLRLSLRLEDGDVLVAVVGRLVPRKGQDVFLDAVRILAQDGLPIRAVIVGEPPARPDTGERAYLERLLTLAVHPALRSRVEFQGFRDDVPALLAASDIVVMPSVNDPFPLALIEAMAAGAAVVATDSGGHAEAIEDGVTGLLVPPRDPSALAAAVARLAWDVLFRGNLAAAARRSAVERFSPETLPARLEVLYRDALRIPSGGYPLIAAKSTDLVEPWILRRSPSRSEPPDWEPTSTAVDRREAP